MDHICKSELKRIRAQLADHPMTVMLIDEIFRLHELAELHEDRNEMWTQLAAARAQCQALVEAGEEYQREAAIFVPHAKVRAALEKWQAAKAAAQEPANG